jgi:hypothetical protein
MLTHFKRICSVIDELPADLDFEVSKLQFSEGSRLLQLLEDQSLSHKSNADSASLMGKDDSQSSLTGSITPNTSLSHRTEGGAFTPFSRAHKTIPDYPQSSTIFYNPIERMGKACCSLQEFDITAIGALVYS